MTAIFDDQERLVKKVNIGLAYERDSRNDAIQVPLEDFESVLFPCRARAKGLGPKMADGKGRVVWQWRVGSNTTPEEWPIIVSCSKGEERVPGEEARDEEAGADVEEERAPGHVRFTVMRSWAPQVRSSLTAGWPTLWTRTRAFLPPAVV